MFLPHDLPVDNKTKDLQYKIIMRIVPANYLLYKMKKVNTQSCTFCMIEPETIEHLFYECMEVKNIWFNVFREWNNVTGDVFVPSLYTCMLGIIDKSVKQHKALNIVLLIVKYFIFKCKYAQCELSVVHLAHMFRNRILLYTNVKERAVYIPLLKMFENN